MGNGFNLPVISTVFERYRRKRKSQHKRKKIIMLNIHNHIIHNYRIYCSYVF